MNSFQIPNSQIDRKKRESFLLGALFSIGGLFLILTTKYHAKDGGEITGSILLILGAIGIYRGFKNKSFFENEAPHIRYSIRDNQLVVKYSDEIVMANEEPTFIDLEFVDEIVVQERFGVVHALKIIMKDKQVHKMLGLNDTWLFIQEIEESLGKSISRKVWRYIN